MPDDFHIDVRWLEGSDGDPADRATFAEIAIGVATQTATELEDVFAQTVRSELRAPAHLLALWLTENWWRLRWEPEARSVDWRLSHVLAAAGGGIAWPNLSLASDGVHILLEGRATTAEGGAPVRYLRSFDEYVTAGTFERVVDEFVERVLARLSSVNVEETELAPMWRQLSKERRDESVVRRRRLEALLGFDWEDAPEELVDSLRGLCAEAGSTAVDEIAAAEKERSVETLEDILHRGGRADVSLKVGSASEIIHQYSSQSSGNEMPWERASRAARLARDVWGVSEGPVLNPDLSDLLGVPEGFLGFTPSNGLPIAAGLRTDHGPDNVKVVMRAKMQTGRRFEIMRLVADDIVAATEERLLPVTAAKTDRQKFQRAFAQEFLLPFDELLERLGRPRPNEDEVGEDDIDDVSQQYDVSPLLVRTVLVNRGYLPRESLDPTDQVRSNGAAA